MFYTVYRTVNLANGKYYFGVHKTGDPSDDYLGSGKYLKAAIAKHGEAAFKKDVLFVYLDPGSAFGKEDELVQCYRSLDPLCMNLKRGGSGGFDWINAHVDIDHRERGVKGGKRRQEQVRKDPKSLALQLKFMEDGRKVALASECNKKAHKAIAVVWIGRKHTEEARKRMSGPRPCFMGRNNPRFGTCWITKGLIERVVEKLKLNEYLNQGWSR